MPSNEIEEAISSDVKGCFEGALTSRIGTDDLLRFGLLDQNGVTNEALRFASSDELVVMPWTYSCTHTGDFLGVAPTQIDIELRGATFVDIRGGDRGTWIFYRYVDYVGALQQIGVTTASRAPVNADQIEKWQVAWDNGREERARRRDEAVANEPVD